MKDDLKMSGSRHSWLLIAGVAAAVIIIGLVVRQDRQEPPSRSGPRSSADPTTQGITSGRKKEQPPHALGSSFRIGNLTCTVDRVAIRERIGNEYVNAEAGEGALFALVTFRIRNDGNRSERIADSDFRIIAHDGREYSPSTEANTTLAVTEDGRHPAITELQPGIAREITTAFHLPGGVVSEGFEVVIPEKGPGSDEARVAVGPDEIAGRR